MHAPNPATNMFFASKFEGRLQAKWYNIGRLMEDGRPSVEANHTERKRRKIVFEKLDCISRIIWSLGLL